MGGESKGKRQLRREIEREVDVGFSDGSRGFLVLAVTTCTVMDLNVSSFT